MTTRQTKVLTLIARGLCRKEIASLLGVNVKTVNFHCDRIRDSLGTSNTVLLTHYALSRKMVKLIQPK